MKTWLKVLVLGVAAWSTSQLLAEENTNGVQKVSRVDGKVFAWEGGKSNLVEKELVFAGNIKVTPEAEFTVVTGKKRQLQNGEALAADGMLTTATGQIIPLADHVAMRGGKVVVVTDGESSALTAPFRLPNGSLVMPDGTMRTPSGGFTRLIDGHLVRTDGTGAIPARDTATLKDNKVFVSKDGSQFEVKPSQSITMNDGSRVYGNGEIARKDGSRVRLSEGELVTFEGVTLQTN